MVFVGTVNYARCKTKKWDALILQKRSVLEVLLSIVITPEATKRAKCIIMLKIITNFILNLLTN